MKVCNLDDRNCIFVANHEWPASFYDHEENQLKYPDYPCNCMPTCTQIKYRLIAKDSDRKPEVYLFYDQFYESRFA